MILKCFLIGLTTVLGGIIASIIVFNFQGKITRKQSKETLKSWVLILFLFTLMIIGLYYVNVYDWEHNSPIGNIVNIRIPALSERQVTVSLYPLPVITSMLLSLLIFFVISITKSITAALKVNPAQTDKRLLDYLHFKELLYCAISIFLFKIIIYFTAPGFKFNGLIASLALFLALGALFYEMLRWVHYPGYHDGLKKKLLCCNVTGIVILWFSFSI
jgi:hypothetical protein